MLTSWDSDAIMPFAGDDYSLAKYYDFNSSYLIEVEARVRRHQRGQDGKRRAGQYNRWDLPAIACSREHGWGCLQCGLGRVAILNGLARQRGGHANPGFDVLLRSVRDFGYRGHSYGAVL